jgi:hypothetical protein
MSPDDPEPRRLGARQNGPDANDRQRRIPVAAHRMDIARREETTITMQYFAIPAVSNEAGSGTRGEPRPFAAGLACAQPRLSGIETRSIDYVMLNERHGKIWHRAGPEHTLRLAAVP